VRNFLIGLLLGAAGVIGLAFLYFRFGAPVSTDAPPMPFEEYLGHTAIHQRAHAAANEKPPIDTSESNLLAGARVYRSSCAGCHSLPGSGETCSQKGMHPPPPSLFAGEGVIEIPAGEIHWVVQNGIRMSGMPAFRKCLPDVALWQVTLLLTKAHELPPAVRQLLAAPVTESDCPVATPSQARR
jgi:mono/diheme cytochrome c family protein